MNTSHRTPKEALDVAIAALGGLSSAARSLPSVRSYQVIQQWRDKGIHAERCPSIERATGGAVTCEELRPDVDWAVLRNSSRCCLLAEPDAAAEQGAA